MTASDAVAMKLNRVFLAKKQAIIHWKKGRFLFQISQEHAKMLSTNIVIEALISSVVEQQREKVFTKERLYNEAKRFFEANCGERK